MYARFLTVKDAIIAIKDFLLGVSPWIPGQGKYGVRSLSEQDLRSAIAQGVPGAEITRLSIEQTDRGTTDRTRVNLEWKEVGRKAGLPASIFTKGTPSKVGSRVIISTFHCHTYESRFYKELQKSIPDLVIQPYVSRSGRGGRFIIAFEDVRGRGDVQMYTCADEAPH